MGWWYSSGGSTSSTQSSTTWTLTANGISDYIFSGPGIEAGNTNDPDIFLFRGQTYNFDNQSGGHPFEIRTSSGGSAYSSGVSQSGTVTTFTVPMNAPSTLYYQCTSHSSMLGTINISSNSSVTNGTNGINVTNNTSGYNANAIEFETDDGNTSEVRWRFTPNGHLLPSSNADYDIGSGWV